MASTTALAPKKIPPMIGIQPDEIEFIADKEPIGIIPNFNFGKMNLISGDVGPFLAGLPITVPFWLAVTLTKKLKCRILIPEWLDETILTDLKDKEIQQEGFVKMPSQHYVIIAKNLFELCPGDVKNADVLKRLIKDIFDIRMSKLKTSVNTFLGGDQTVAKVDNLTMLEISTIRPFFPHALEQIFRIKKALTTALVTANSSQNETNSMSMSMSDSGPSQSQIQEESQ